MALVLPSRAPRTAELGALGVTAGWPTGRALCLEKATVCHCVAPSSSVTTNFSRGDSVSPGPVRT